MIGPIVIGTFGCLQCLGPFIAAVLTLSFAVQVGALMNLHHKVRNAIREFDEESPILTGETQKYQS